MFGLEDGRTWCFRVSEGMQKEQLGVLQEEPAWIGRLELQGGPGVAP